MAEGFYKRALEIDPDNAIAMKNLEIIRARMKQ